MSPCPKDGDIIPKAGVYKAYALINLNSVVTLLMAVKAGSQAVSRSCTSNAIQLDITLKKRCNK